MRDRLLVIATAAAIATAILAPAQSAAACSVNGPYYGSPALYGYYGLALPMFYYGGFYTPRVVSRPAFIAAIMATSSATKMSGTPGDRHA
jgi:hypothetical protein